MPPNEAPLASFYPGEDERHSSAPTVARVQDDQIRVEDKLYSTEKLAELHPGGPLFIKVRDETYGANDWNLNPTRSLRHSLAEMLLRRSYRTTVGNFPTSAWSWHWKGGIRPCTTLPRIMQTSLTSVNGSTKSCHALSLLLRGTITSKPSILWALSLQWRCTLTTTTFTPSLSAS